MNMIVRYDMALPNKREKIDSIYLFIHLFIQPFIQQISSECLLYVKENCEAQEI